MLIGGILIVFGGIILMVFSLFLNKTFFFSQEIADSFSTVGYYLKYANLFLPVDALTYVLSFTIVLLLTYFGYRVATYVLSFIRGNDTPDKNI